MTYPPNIAALDISTSDGVFIEWAGSTSPSAAEGKLCLFAFKLQLHLMSAIPKRLIAIFDTYHIWYGDISLRLVSIHMRPSTSSLGTRITSNPVFSTFLSIHRYGQTSPRFNGVP